MEPTKELPPASKKAAIAGWILGVLPALMMFLSAYMKFAPNDEAKKGFEHLGWPMSSAVPLGVVELACVLLYLIPQTAVLGAILLAGYLGGAIATHARVGDPFIIPAVMGVVFWLGLYLRDPRLRALAPLRSPR